MRGRRRGSFRCRAWSRALLVPGFACVAIACLPARVLGQADEGETITLQYRVARDAFAPSAFVAVVDGGISPPLKLIWDLPDWDDDDRAQRQSREKRDFDGLIERLERESLNGVEFLCTGVWLEPGLRLRVTSVPRLTEAGRRRLQGISQAADRDRPTVGVLALHSGTSGTTGADLAVQEAADRLHEVLVYALQQDSQVRWSEPHEDLQSPVEGWHRLARLIVDYVVMGDVRAVDGGFSCKARLASVKTGEVASFTVLFGEGEEERAAAELGERLVAAIARPTG